MTPVSLVVRVFCRETMCGGCNKLEYFGPGIKSLDHIQVRCGIFGTITETDEMRHCQRCSGCYQAQAKAEELNVP